jgi:hypothetical protein
MMGILIVTGFLVVDKDFASVEKGQDKDVKNG